MKYGIQLYSVRDGIGQNLLGTLKYVKSLGYENVELFGGEFAALDEKGALPIIGALNDTGLRVSGMHTSLPVLQEQLDAVARTIKHVGSNRLILAWTNPQTQSEALELVRRIEGWRVSLEKLGVKLGYHNHAQEFAPIEGGKTMLELLFEETRVFFELDTYWVYRAGHDPIAWMDKVYKAKRLPVIHIKDGLPDGTGKPLGLGAAPWKAVWAHAKELGVEMVVESETQEPSGEEEIRICMEALRALEDTAKTDNGGKLACE